MSRGLGAAAGRGGRYFIGAATATYGPQSGLDDRPELAGELDRARRLFLELGYKIVSGFGVDLPRDRFVRRLRSFLTSRSRVSTDVVVVYYTGHGLPSSSDVLLPMAAAGADLPFTALRAGDLTGRLLETDVATTIGAQQLLFILDTCHAAAATTTMTDGVVRFLDSLRATAEGPSLGVLVSARPYERSAAGAFTQALEAAIHSQATGGFDTEFLPLDGITGVVNDLAPRYQHARAAQIGERVARFFPNPRYSPFLPAGDVLTRRQTSARPDGVAEFSSHILPRAQGLDRVTGAGDPWLFTGRHAALRRVCQWLEGDGPPSMVITGDPGSGKSALLARLFVLAGKWRRRVPDVHLLPDDTVPRSGSIGCFIHARSYTVPDLIAAIADGCRLGAVKDLTSLIQAARLMREPVSVIVDAVDESITERDEHGRTTWPIVDEALTPLMATGGHGLRLLVGTRSHLVPQLGEPSEVVDLDGALYADPDSVRRYVRSCLTSLVKDSPYSAVNLPENYLRNVAEAIAAKAGASFLVGLIVSRSLATRRELIDPGDPHWRASLPTVASDALRQDLHSRLGADAAKARDLLLPLAYAQSSGLPWEDVWPALVRDLTGAPYTNDDLDWLLDTAGYYVVETTYGHRSVYRLYHESLAEHIREGRDPQSDNAAITRTLAGKVPLLPDGSPDWSRAHPYTAVAIASHAAMASVLDPLLEQPRFLLDLPAAALLPALTMTRTPEGRATADTYQRALPRLHSYPDDRAAYLMLTARCGGLTQLAEAISASLLPLGFVTDWASWRFTFPHRSLAGGDRPVPGLAFGLVDGRHVVAAAGNGVVRMWDAVTGAAVGTPINVGSDGGKLRFGELDGRSVLLCAHDTVVEVIDARAGVVIGEPRSGFAHYVSGLAVSVLDGRTVVVAMGTAENIVQVWQPVTNTTLWSRRVSGGLGVQDLIVIEVAGRPAVAVSAGLEIRLYDLRSGTPVGVAIDVGERINSLAAGTVLGLAAIAAALDDHSIRMWDPATGSPIGRPMIGHSRYIRSLAFAELYGRPIVVSGSHDHSVRVWDATTGAPIGAPFLAHKTDIWAVAATNVDGRCFAASADLSGAVLVWDVATAVETPTAVPFTGHNLAVTAIAMSVVAERTLLVTGSDDATVRVWDAASGALVAGPLIGHTTGICALAIGVCETGPFVVSADALSVRMWNVHTEEVLGEQFVHQSGYLVALGAVCLEGRPVAVLRNSNSIAVWAGTADGLHRHRPFTVEEYVAVATGRLAGSPVAVVCAGGGGLAIIDIVDGSVIDLLPEPAAPTALAMAEVSGTSYIVAGDQMGSIVAWDVGRRSRIDGFPRLHDGRIRSVAIAVHGDTATVVTGSADKTVRLWDLLTGRPIGEPFTAHVRQVVAVAAAPAGERTAVASVGEWQNSPLVWDKFTRRSLPAVNPAHDRRVTSVAVGSLAGRRVVVSGSLDYTVRIWDAATGEPIGEPLAANTADALGNQGDVNVVAIARIGGRDTILSGGADRSLHMWDAAGRPVGDPVPAQNDLFDGILRGVTTIAIGDAGDRQVIVSGGVDRTIRVWDAETLTLLGPPIRAHARAVRSLKLGEFNGHSAIVSVGHGDIRVRDILSGDQLVAPILAHHRGITSIELIRLRGQLTVLSASEDGTVGVWSIEQGKPIDEPFQHGWPVNSLATVEVSGRYIAASGGADQQVAVWDVQTRKVLKKIDVGSTCTSLAFASPSQLIVGCDLGILSIRI